MTILPSGLLENIYGSLDIYLQAALTFADTTPITLRLHGERRFIPPVDAPWVEIHYDFLGLQEQFMRQTGFRAPDASPDGSVYATERRGYLQCNIYQRARLFATRYLTVQARDRVVQAFPDGGVLPIYDIGAGTPYVQVGTFLLDGVQEHVTDIGLRSGITQRVIQVATRYLESFTRIGG